MHSDVAACRAGDPMHVAASLMWRHDCGFVPVADGATGRVEGVVTDRDLCMAALLSGRGLAELTVGDAMARDPATCHPDDDLRAVHATMRERRIRRLPVVDDDGVLVGVVSLGDLVREAFGARTAAAARRQRDVGKSLAAVSEQPEDEHAAEA